MTDDTLVILVTAAVAWSVVELLNQLPVSFRIWINREAVWRWLRKGAGPTNEDPSYLEKQLVGVATGRNDIALYCLESDQLSAEINAAAEIALDRPRVHSELLGALAGVDVLERSIDELKSFFEAPSTLPGENTSSKIAQTRHLLTLRIQRRLDALQITTRRRQYVATQLQQIVVAIIATTAFQLGYPRHLVLGVLAGFVSPVIARLIRAVRA